MQSLFLDCYYSLTAKCVLLISSHKIIMCIPKCTSCHCCWLCLGQPILFFGWHTHSARTTNDRPHILTHSVVARTHNILSNCVCWVPFCAVCVCHALVVKVRCVLSCYLLLKHLSCTLIFRHDMVALSASYHSLPAKTFHFDIHTVNDGAQQPEMAFHPKFVCSYFYDCISFVSFLFRIHCWADNNNH